MKRLEAGGFLSCYLPDHRMCFGKGITERLGTRQKLFCEPLPWNRNFVSLANFLKIEKQIIIQHWCLQRRGVPFANLSTVADRITIYSKCSCFQLQKQS